MENLLHIMWYWRKVTMNLELREVLIRKQMKIKVGRRCMGVETGVILSP